MRVERVIYFIESVRAGSIRAASETLGITQSALGDQITALEEELNVRLVRRGRHGITMTASGQKLFGQAVELVDAQRALIDAAMDITNDVSGLVRVGANPLLAISVVTPVIIDLQRIHTGLLSRIREAASKDLEEQIARGQLDFAAMTTPTEPPLGAVVREPVADFRVAAYVPPGHALHGRSGLTWSDLAPEPLVALRPGTTLGDRVFANLPEPRIVAEVASLHHVTYMVDNGMGVGIGSVLSTPFGAQQGRWIPIDGETTSVHISSAAGIPMPKAVRLVRDAVRARLLREARELTNP